MILDVQALPHFGQAEKAWAENDLEAARSFLVPSSCVFSLQLCGSVVQLCRQQPLLLTADFGTCSHEAGRN